MKSALIAAVASVLLALTPVAGADSITLEPSPDDLYDLPHQYYYTWGLATEDDASLLVVTDATLTFKYLRNNDWSDNKLYVHLLDTAPEGVTSYYDNQGGGDNFAGQGIELVTYTNLSPIPYTREYEFTADEIATLNDYLDNGSDFALGFDPDCHFYNCGVEMSVETTTTGVPEPSTMLLVSAGLLAVGKAPRRRKADG